MALVFVSKGMQVAHPVGQVNLHPLPAGLPSGLERAHLMRHSLDAVRMNLVDGRLTEIDEHIAGSGGVLTYHDTFVHSTHRMTGWRDSSYAVDYSVGYTWMAVGFFNPDEFACYAATESHTPTPVGIGEELAWRSGGVAFRLRRGSTTTHTAVVMTPPPEGLFMGFGVLDRAGGTASTYVPHIDTISSEEPHPDEAPPPDVPGIVLCMGSPNFGNAHDVPTDARMACFAAWERPLTQEEMHATYLLLKPWLLARGVEIA